MNRYVALLLWVAMLPGCASPGWQQNPVASPLSFPLAIDPGPQQFHLVGYMDGMEFTHSETQTPGPASTFEGKPASTRIETYILRANGTLVSKEVWTSFFDRSMNVEYGSINLGDDRYVVFNQVPQIPSTAKVGQSGLVGTVVTYANSSKSKVLNIGTATWRLDPATATTALLCAKVHVASATPFDGSQCDRIDSAGNILGRIVTVVVAGKTLTLQ